MYRIAVVEDDSMMQRLLVDMFEGQECEVKVWGTGEAALKELPAHRPDIVILDVNLPDMTGHEICRALKADPQTKAIPVLMLTGESRSLEQRVEALELGADDYLFKPVSAKVLIARVTSLLRSAAQGSR